MNTNAYFKASVRRKLRENWSPEQALAIYDLLCELTEIIWEYYETELSELMHQRAEYDKALLNRSANLSLNDNIPF